MSDKNTKLVVALVAALVVAGVIYFFKGRTADQPEVVPTPSVSATTEATPSVSPVATTSPAASVSPKATVSPSASPTVAD